MPDEAVVVTGPWLLENPTNDEDLGYVKDWVITDTTLTETEEQWESEAFKALKEGDESRTRFAIRIKGIQLSEPAEDKKAGKLHCFGLFHGQAPEQYLYNFRFDSFLWLTVSFRRHEIKMKFELDGSKGTMTPLVKVVDSDLEVSGGIDFVAKVSNGASRFAGGFDQDRVSVLSQVGTLARLTKELMAEKVYRHKHVEDRQPPRPRINKRGIFKKR